MARNNDPFNENTSRFGSRPQPATNNAPEPAPVTPPSFPSLPGAPKKMGTIPAPTLPQQPQNAPQTPVTPLPATDTGMDVSAAPEVLPGPGFTRRKNPTEELFTGADQEYKPYVDPATRVQRPQTREATPQELQEILFGEVQAPGWENQPFDKITDQDDYYLERLFDATTAEAQQTLYALAADPEDNVRISVAENPNTPATLLNVLAKDKEQDVRREVMLNPNVSFETYNAFYSDPEIFIVADWIGHNRTTTEMLTPLFNTENDFIASILVQSDKVPFNTKQYLTQKFNLNS